jgi:uroporphyrinogen-III synthase
MTPGPRLAGTHVLVTRPRGRAEELCFLLEDEGATVALLPLLELLPPEDPRPLQAAAERLSRYDWVVVSSPQAVEALVEAAREAGTQGALARARLAAVGPKTAKRARRLGVEPTLLALESTGTGLFEALQPHLEPGAEVLLLVAENGRPELTLLLEEADVRLTRVVAYRSQAAAVPKEALASLLARPPDVVVFASPRTAEAFLEAADGLGAQPPRHAGLALLRRTRLVAIGPTTAGALQGLGLEVTAVAERPTAEAVVEAVIRAVGEALRPEAG